MDASGRFQPSILSGIQAFERPVSRKAVIHRRAVRGLAEVVFLYIVAQVFAAEAAPTGQPLLQGDWWPANADTSVAAAR